MNATKPTTTTPTQGHMSEPWLPFYPMRDGSEGTVKLGEVDYTRARLCVNACTGLTAEQVAKIPEIINLSIKLRGALGKHGELSDILSKLAAFETMREALEGMLTNIYPPGSVQDINIEDSARDALKLADDCEATP